MSEPNGADVQDPGLPASTLTHVLWRTVTGERLEELLYGLLDAMGASSLTWRAGANAAVTSPDGGRDLEAVFDRPSPDGELDRQRWWVECKGRVDTVERSAVQQAVLDASARSDIDVLVIATNSRFSNPTEDWVAEWARSHQRPQVRLWNRDRLARLVRRYPTVAVRVLPEALNDLDRLQLLVSRFFELGEEPALLDVEFFWERRELFSNLDADLVARAIAMFLYTEGMPLPRSRPWWHLVSEANAISAIVVALLTIPTAVSGELPRPLEQIRALASAGRLLIGAVLALPDETAQQLIVNPWAVVVDGDGVAGDPGSLQEWVQGALLPVLAFVRSDLLDACSSDCRRVSGDNPHEVESLTATSFWRLLADETSEPPEGAGIAIETLDETCTVGLDMKFGCPLVVSNNDHPAEVLVRDLIAILRFRKHSPDDVSQRRLHQSGAPMRLTVLRDNGLSWGTREVGVRGSDDSANPHD